MRRSEVLVAAVAAGGLIFAIIAEAAQQRLIGHPTETPPPAAASDGNASGAREWRDTDLSADEYLDLSFASKGGLTEAALARIAAIEPAAGGEAADPVAALLMVRTLSGETLALIADRSLSDDARAGQFRALLLRDFDLPLIAKFALGRHWKSASDDQKRAYVDAFAGNILRSYTSRILNAEITGIDIQGSQPAGREDVLVLSRVLRRDGEPVDLSWRLRQREGQFRIIDVVVEGVSLALTKRQEFATFIQSGAADLDGLIRRLSGKSA